jgi:hypothetical protein
MIEYLTSIFDIPCLQSAGGGFDIRYLSASGGFVFSEFLFRFDWTPAASGDPRVINRVVVDSCPSTNYIAFYTEENKSLPGHTQGSACSAFGGSFSINDSKCEYAIYCRCRNLLLK